jgi:hypothetical protein
MDLDGRKGIFTRITWQRKSCTNKNKFTIKNKESLAEYKGKKTNRADGSEEGRSMKTLDEILEPWGNTKHQFITMLRTTMQHQERNPWNHDGPETDRGRKGIEYQNPKTNSSPVGKTPKNKTDGESKQAAKWKRQKPWWGALDPCRRKRWEREQGKRLDLVGRRKKG